jgi:hypothetical protein
MGSKIEDFVAQQPSGAMNWGIGCVGEGPMGKAVEPASLYLERLRERLGEQSLANIGLREVGLGAS